MNVFDERIGRDDAAVRARRLPNRGVIADSAKDPAIRRMGFDERAQLRYQCIF